MFTNFATLTTGSEKQIAWAEKLRWPIISQFDNLMEKNLAEAIKQGKIETCRPLWEACRTWITSQSDASFWIDNRNTRPFDLARIALKGAKDAGLY